jgi:hypothetical protein
MKVTPIQILIIVSIIVGLLYLRGKKLSEGLCQVGSLNNTVPVLHSRIQPCDTSLGQAPLGNPQTWTRQANPVLTGMYN